MKNVLFIAILLLLSLSIFAQNQPIVVTSPNGGESWAVGTTHTITWNTAMLSGNVHIQLHRGSSATNLTNIAENVPVANGSYTWSIPNATAISSEYKIKISLLADPTTNNQIFDESNAFFAITGSTPPPSALTLTSPNGGENWVVGTPHPITWTFTNITGNVSLQLIREQGTTDFTVITNDVPVTNGTFMWNIPTTIAAGTNYRVKIIKAANTTNPIFDISNEPFTITSNATVPTLTVTSPNGGENWETGSTHNITWNHSGIEGNIRIDLISPLANVMPVIIAETPVGSGTFAWTIPATITPATFYRIMISKISADGTMISDASDADFTISGGTLNPAINVTAPNGGESWAVGSTHTITWTSAMLSGNVHIQLHRGYYATNLINIAEDIPVANGSYTWTIPATLEGSNQYKVKISFPPDPDTNNQIFDESDAFFTITTPTPPMQTLTLISPNGGEVWAAGTEHPITWTSTNLTGNISLQLIREVNSTVFTTIANDIPVQNGTFMWTIPAITVEGTNYRVKIVKALNPAITLFDYSQEPFTITSNAPVPLLTITSPNGGENWAVGSTHNITWNHANVEGNIRIDLVSPLDNVLPQIVAMTPVASGSYAWTIPASIPPAGFYRVMISKTNANGVIVSDISDEDFTITNTIEPMSITVTSPNGGENWMAGTMHPITWISTGLNGMVRITLSTPYPTYAEVVIAPSVPVETGVFDWAIPQYMIAMPGYRVAINWLDDPTVAIGDASDADFTISSGTENPTISVTSPNGGENWVKGTMHPITWNSQDITGNVQIGLVRANSGNTSVLVIARNAPNTGIFNWTIPQRIRNGSAYKIVVRSQVNHAILDYSDAPFTISGTNVNPFTVTTAVATTTGQVAFSISSGSSAIVSAAVYNIKGQCIRQLSKSELVAGKGTLSWNGQDNNGKTVNKGLYFLRVQSGKDVVTKKFMF